MESLVNPTPFEQGFEDSMLKACQVIGGGDKGQVPIGHFKEILGMSNWLVVQNAVICEQSKGCHSYFSRRFTLKRSTARIYLGIRQSHLREAIAIRFFLWRVAIQRIGYKCFFFCLCQGF
jgi:hypothetical protein